MVLSMKQTEEQIKNIETSLGDYIVLSTKKYLYYDDTLLFKKSIEVLNAINMMIIANDALKMAKSNLVIDTKSMYLLVESTMSSKQLNDEQLKKVFKSIQTMDLFRESISKFSNISDAEFIPYDILFTALGLPLEKQKKITDEKEEVWHTDFAVLYCDMLTTDITIDNFIKDVKILINKFDT